MGLNDILDISFECFQESFFHFGVREINNFNEQTYTLFISDPFCDLPDEIIKYFLFLFCKHSRQSKSENKLGNGHGLILFFSDLENQIVESFLGFNVFFLAFLPQSIKLILYSLHILLAP